MTDGISLWQKLWAHQTAYDRSFAGLSPGTMLIPAVIDYGFSHGCGECDFLDDDEEPYKLRWSAGFHETFHLQIRNRQRFSWAYRSREGLNQRLDRCDK